MSELCHPSEGVWLDVVVTAPAHSGLGDTLVYTHAAPLPAGSLVRVPLGRRDVMGVVWGVRHTLPTEVAGERLRPVSSEVAGVPPLDDAWRALVSFAARYYQRSLGEVALAALPPALRDLQPDQVARRLRRLTAQPLADGSVDRPPLSPDQQRACTALADADRPVLLFGATGSGKTEVYLRAAEAALTRDAHAQVLVLVPEINLTPQLEQRFAARFAGQGVVTLHSGLTPAQRLRHWLLAHLGHARIVLGTRMAIFASLPHLRLIVVDEEHDPSYKSQEGARFSARDLAVYRARQGTGSAVCQVILGSATPSLESWHAADQGRYLRLEMPARIGEAALPRLRMVDMNQQPRQTVIAPALLQAMTERAARGEQSLVLLNRRGYAPVLACHDCGWKSGCPHCSAHTVFHKIDRTLRCHHCGYSIRVPKACPDCGNLDIATVGRGTEQLEEQLAGWLADARRPDGQAVKVARLDADSTRAKGSLERQLADMHAGEVDVLVGTQMVAKGHDFRRITLVASLNTDSGLFASDYRAPERLFALLMQVAGRAGRDAAFVQAQGTSVELWVQTWYPQHPLFAALARHDYPAFARQQLAERASAQMPPMGYQALVRAEARELSAAQAWLSLAADAGEGLPGRGHLTLYPAVPMVIQRVANIKRAQMLIESPSRPALQAFLTAWQPRLHGLRHHPQARGVVRWAIDVDPVSI